MTKFYEEFLKNTKSGFPMIKYNSSTYLKDKRELTVRFIVSALDIASLTDDKKKEILAAVSKMFDGVKVNVEYIRTFADVNVVKNKVMEFFNQNNQMLFNRMRDENLTIFVTDTDIEVKFNFETPTYKMLTAGNTLEKLTDWLETSFIPNIDVTAEEIPVDLKEVLEKEDLHIDTTVAGDSGLRLVSIETGEKVYGRGRVEGITQMPNYIADVKGAAENIVLCGKISNISSRTYMNKKYDANNPKNGPKELPIIRFWLDDTTGKIECVCFPRPEEAQKIENLKEQSHIVCAGKVGISTYNGALSFTVNVIFTCNIDFDSIKLKSAKPVPERYEIIKPQPFKCVTQNSLFDSDTEVSEFFKNKTYVVYDLEATDKFPETAEIIEIAAIKIVDGKEVETFQTLVKPPQPIPAEITALTHIDNVMVANAPNIDSVIPDFYKFSRNAALVGHNIAGYDYPLLNKYADKLGYNIDNELVDTLLLSRKYLTELNAFSLEKISKAFNFTHENAHRAMSDVLATSQLLKLLAKRIK